MATILQTKATTTTLAAYLELQQDDQMIRNPNPNCRCSRNSHPTKRTLSWTARAVVFGTILIKRVRERKRFNQQKSDGRKRSSDEELKAVENRENQLVSLSSLQSGSSPSSPISNEKRSGSGARRRDVEPGSWYALNSGVGLVVVSLVGVTVMQGRVIAILITSIWVYFVGWMHMEDRGMKKKPTKFKETEVGVIQSCRLMETSEKRH